MTTRQLSLERSQWIIGFMSMGELSFLAEIADQLGDNSIIYEIGSLCGRSTRAIADNSSDNCKIYCIDPWEFEIPTESNIPIVVNKITYEQFCINLHDYISSSKVIPCISKWEDFIPPDKADFIFIDGNHEYKSIYYDISKSLKSIKDNGIIAGHDYNFGTVFKAVNEFFLGNEIHTRENIWWTRKF